MFVRVSQRSALQWYVCAHQNNSRSCNLKNVLTHLDREMVVLCTPVMVSLFTARGWGVMAEYQICEFLHIPPTYCFDFFAQRVQLLRCCYQLFKQQKRSIQQTEQNRNISLGGVTTVGRILAKLGKMD